MAPIHLGNTGNIRELSFSGAQNSRWTLNGPFFLLPDVSPDVGAAAVEHGDEQLRVPRQVAELDRQPQPLVPLPPFRERLKNAQRIFFEKFRQVFSKRPKVDSIFFNPIKFWENTWMKEIWEARPQQLRRQGEKKRFVHSLFEAVKLWLEMAPRFLLPQMWPWFRYWWTLGWLPGPR